MNIDGDSISDAIASDYLHDGWFNQDISPEERHDAREAFEQFVDDYDWEDGYDWADFWDDWREWYGSQ